MFKPHLLQHVKLICKHRPFQSRLRFYSNSRKPYDPLRILFCGADEFSIFSLKAIRDLQHRRPECVASIDVVCRPDKRVGRGLKRVQEVPIKSVARGLEIPIHQIDTFTGWSPPSPVDLIIAVSFGLLVPSRILKGATWGGLNVHPSMLPYLRGPAPVQHALLKGRTHTGVTLQTMHPTRFDHGVILAQTPGPGVRISEECTPDDLIRSLGEAGAGMLVRGVEDGLFVDPVPVVDGKDAEGRAEHAPKILPEDRHIDWNTWTADQIMRYDRVLGRLWDTTTWQKCQPGSTVSKRVTFHGPWRSVSCDQVSASTEAGKPAVLQIEESQSPTLLLPTADGHLLTPASATIEGEQKGKGIAALIRAKTSTS
ncbi:hypothetical protein M409DRAFT_70824 [Zasmidium cellare ATCC 36951]|uniref:methionyl-tRNA formyltransferase n=1 Tax=Zasmidium cellare ATCC 36951 TaxID=1080233 RepID=A0A6A6C236_ZASCE|nr:uncharacterized protein M409DRAFT_70824 [Zasmidium cellare ATCC 36951]KAF2159779.1 hypothetical protein M409DRAFT_70824 [Zasmidium cellare ATCC 36951]